MACKNYNIVYVGEHLFDFFITYCELKLQYDVLFKLLYFVLISISVIISSSILK